MNRTYHATEGASFADLGFSEFVEPDVKHEFSARYQQRRQALIQEVAQVAEQHRTSTASNTAPRFTWRVAAAVAAVCVALPAAAWAVVNNTDFFAGAFGDGWRTSQAAKQSFQDQGGEKAPVPVVYPASEVVQLDPEAAEELLGDAVCNEAVTITSPDGHELTITSAVRSENALVYRFTLHRDGGVTCLAWDDHTNNVAAKGAYPPLDTQFSWAAGGDEFIYVDPNASTADTIVGYAYSVFGASLAEGQPAVLTTYTCDVPFNQDFTENQFHMQTYEIPCTSVASSTAFASNEGSAISLSPLGLVLEERALFAQPIEPDGYDMAYDPVNVRRIAVQLADGTSYTVFDKAENMDNTLSACGFDTNLVVAFNRLVDPAHVEAIEVDVTDAQTMDELEGENGWPTDADWPVRTITYTLA